MKILFAIKSLGSTRGGAERVLTDIANGLFEQNHDISVLTYDPADARPLYPLLQDIVTFFLGIGRSDQSTTIGETLKRMSSLRRSVKKQKPDVVVAFMHSMFVPLSFALIGTGVPVIASEHIVPAHYRTRKIEFILLFLSSFFVKKITVLSEDVKSSYPKFLQRKMVAITNPVSQPDVVKRQEKTNEEQKVILNVGRLSDQKNQAFLIECFTKIASQNSDWVLKIIGEGELRSDLEALIQDLSMQDQVFLCGTKDDIEQEYLNADIFVLPSNYESFGLALVEAMAHGLPVIGFADCQGVNELIQNQENGLLIDADDKDKNFIDGLEQLIQSSDLRQKMGEAGQKIAQKFAPEKIVALWEDIINKVVR